VIPINMIGMMGGGGFDESDLERWQCEWHTSKDASRRPVDEDLPGGVFSLPLVTRQ